MNQDSSFSFADLFRQRRRIPVVLQSESSECGIACLAAVLKYFGHETDLNSVRSSVGSSVRGVTLAQLMSIAGGYGLAARVLRLEPEGLGSLKTPCILHWNMNHFVLLERVRGKTVVIVDPAVGRRTLALDKVSESFTGIALELRPKDGFSVKKEERRLTLGTFFKNVDNLLPSLAKLLALSLALQVFALLAPFFSQLVIDQVIESRDTNLLLLLTVSFGAIAIISVLVSAIRSFFVMHFGVRLQLEWAAQLFSHLIRLPLSYFEKRHIGDVLSRFRSLQPIQQLVTTTIVEAIMDGAMALTTLAVMLLYSPSLTAVSLIALAIYSVIRAIFYTQQRELAQEQLVASAKENSHFLETLRGMIAIKGFSREDVRLMSWQAKASDAAITGMRGNTISALEQSANQVLFSLENVIVIWIGATQIMSGGFSVGMLVAFLAYKMQFTSRASALIDKTTQYLLSSVNLDRIADIALTEPEEDRMSSIRELTLQGRLRLQNVSFRYSPTDPLIIDSACLDIEPGECIAVVAPSGTGKTTLLKIMMGLLRPDSGDVLADDHSIWKVGASAYRRKIAAVMQEDTIFSGSLRDNISFFDQSADVEWLEECAKAACIHADIAAMPMGYHTQVGDMGSSLSGGQRQRILIARALYARPQILFLDEATSHLDPTVERRIHDKIGAMNITRIIVAHRRETLQIATRIVQFDQLKKATGDLDVRSQEHQTAPLLA